MRAAWPLAFGLSGALLVWGASLLLPDRYTSTAMLRINVEPFPTADVINHAWQVTVSRQALKRLIERLNLYPEERERLPLEDVIENAKKDDIRLEIKLDHDVILTFAYRDPDTAKAVAAALIDEMVAASEDRARSSPGWGRLEVKSSVVVEHMSTGLAFWKASRYVAKGTLLVRKQDDFKFDRQVAVQRAQSVRRKAFAQLRYSVESYGSVEDLNRHLQIDADVNFLIIKLTDSDARRAQLITSRLVTGVVDNNQHMPDCPLSPPDAPSNSADATPQHLLPGAVSPKIDIAKEFQTGTEFDGQPMLDGLQHTGASVQMLAAKLIAAIPTRQSGPAPSTFWTLRHCPRPPTDPPDPSSRPSVSSWAWACGQPFAAASIC